MQLNWTMSEHLKQTEKRVEFDYRVWLNSCIAACVCRSEEVLLWLGFGCTPRCNCLKVVKGCVKTVLLA